jgi:hypothetical protein
MDEFLCTRAAPDSERPATIPYHGRQGGEATWGTVENLQK